MKKKLSRDTKHVSIITIMIGNGKSEENDIGTQHFNIGNNLRHKGFYLESIEELKKAIAHQEMKLGANTTTVAISHYNLGLANRGIKNYKHAIDHLQLAQSIFEFQMKKLSKAGGNNKKSASKEEEEEDEEDDDEFKTFIENYEEKEEEKEKEKEEDATAKKEETEENAPKEEEGVNAAKEEEKEEDKEEEEGKKEEEEADKEEDEKKKKRDAKRRKKRKKFATRIKNCKLNLARAYHSRGVIYQRNGDYKSSVLEHRKALALRESQLGRSHMETAQSHYVMGCALSDNGNYDEALGELRRALRTKILVLGREHQDSVEVIENIGVVLHAKGRIDASSVSDYKATIVRSIECEIEGDIKCRKEEFEDAMTYYRKALALETRHLGDLHPCTCDLYLRMAEALGESGDLEKSLVEYKSAIAIYERMLGKFHVKMAAVYTKLAGVLMDKGEYETALAFYAKSYSIYDGTLGMHEDTKQSLMNVKLAAEECRTKPATSNTLEILVKAEEEFIKRHPAFSKQNDEDGKGEENGGSEDKNPQDNNSSDGGEAPEEKVSESGKEEYGGIGSETTGQGDII